MQNTNFESFCFYTEMTLFKSFREQVSACIMLWEKIVPSILGCVMNENPFITHCSDLHRLSVGQLCEKYADMISFVLLFFITHIWIAHETFSFNLALIIQAQSNHCLNIYKEIQVRLTSMFKSTIGPWMRKYLSSNPSDSPFSSQHPLPWEK